MEENEIKDQVDVVEDADVVIVNDDTTNVIPSDPAVDPSDSAIDPSDPAVDPSDPAVDPSDPAVDPSDPAVDPSDPSVILSEAKDLSEGEEVAAEGEEADREISDEELDKIADTAIAFLESVLPYMNVGEVVINEYEGDEGELILNLTGDDLAILIGRHGKTLDALQYLVSTATVRAIGYRYPVVVDVEGYKARQREKLENIALSAAERAVSQNRSVKLRPMTPYERRIVHMALANDERVDTASEGEGAARRVVVLPQ